MILVLSGEGPTDIGTMRPTKAGWKFAPGPMAWIADKLLEHASQLGYSVLDHHGEYGDCVYFLSEAELAARRLAKPIRLPTLASGKGNQGHLIGAFHLGRFARDIAGERNAPVIAVFFRDGDGTRTASRLA